MDNFAVGQTVGLDIAGKPTKVTIKSLDRESGKAELVTKKGSVITRKISSLYKV